MTRIELDGLRILGISLLASSATVTLTLVPLFEAKIIPDWAILTPACVMALSFCLAVIWRRHQDKVDLK